MADHTIEWYGPKRGKKSVEGIVSNMPGTVKAVKTKAKSMASEAWVLLEAHKANGSFGRSAHPRIKVGGSRTGLSLDWYVYLEADSYVKTMGPMRKNAADAAAMGIEFGGGRAFGKGDNRTAGLHILGRVIASNVGRF
jgi:hypothetical protein